MTWDFKPQDDLTVLELAYIASHLVNGLIADGWQRVNFSTAPEGRPPASIARHFQPSPPKDIPPKNPSWYERFLGDAK